MSLTKDHIIAKSREFIPQIRDALCRLIEIPTPNPPGRNYEECVAYCQHLLESLPVETWIIRVPDQLLPILAPLGEGLPRPILIGRWGRGRRALHFHGHYDVVNPIHPGQFQPRVEGDLIYGRGAADMKGGLVSIVFALKTLHQMGFQPKEGSITLSFAPDEETGGAAGAGYLLEHYPDLMGELPSATIMPEPSGGVIYHGFKGAVSWELTVRGKTSHSIYPFRGVNAFEGMVRLAERLMELKERLSTGRSRFPFEPPEAAVSTLVLGGALKGREQFNIVPDRASFSLDYRFIPEESLTGAKKELMGVIEELRQDGVEIEINPITESEPGFTPSDSDICQTLLRSAKEITGREPPLRMLPGFIDIRYFVSKGVPSLMYGPGALEVVHQENEHISLEEVIRAVQVLALTAVHFLS